VIPRPALLLPLALLAACSPPQTSGPLRQEAYVWQRSWSPAVRAAVRQASGISGFVVLAAEVELRQGAPRVARVPFDAETWKGRRVGAAVRVTTLPARFVDEPDIVRLLQEVVREVAAEAQGKGISLAEVQLDYDCPESKLDDYRGLLPILKQAAAPVPLTFTALPSWLRQRRAFAALIAAADGYVLQVHSLAPPASADAGRGEIPLLDPRAAREWAAAAARFGRSFRVALPTYGYLAAWDARGRLLGLSAEGPALAWPPGATLREARSDPALVAGLVREWTRERPRELAGLLWYRLPVADDRRNWPWPALRAVMAGRSPRGEPRAVVREPEPGLAEVDLLNAGDGDAALPSPVRIRWGHETLLAADGLAGYRIAEAPGPDGLRLTLPDRPTPPRLRPGERRQIAWLRFAARTEIRVELPPPSDPRAR
jgi:hypothetical protein